MYTGRTLVQFTSRSLSSDSVSSLPCQSSNHSRCLLLWARRVTQQIQSSIASTPCAGTWGRRRPLPGAASGRTAAAKSRKPSQHASTLLAVCINRNR